MGLTLPNKMREKWLASTHIPDARKFVAKHVSIRGRGAFSSQASSVGSASSGDLGDFDDDSDSSELSSTKAEEESDYDEENGDMFNMGRNSIGSSIAPSGMKTKGLTKNDLKNIEVKETREAELEKHNKETCYKITLFVKVFDDEEEERLQMVARNRALLQQRAQMMALYQARVAEQQRILAQQQAMLRAQEDAANSYAIPSALAGAGMMFRRPKDYTNGNTNNGHTSSSASQPQSHAPQPQQVFAIPSAGSDQGT